MQLCCFQEKPQAAIFCLAPRQAVAEKDDKTSLYRESTFTSAGCDIFIHCPAPHTNARTHTLLCKSRKTKRTKFFYVKYWTTQDAKS